MMTDTNEQPTRTNEQIKDRIREINEAKGSSFALSGNKDELLATLAEAEEYEPEEDEVEDDGVEGEGDATVVAHTPDPKVSDTVLGQAGLGEMTGPDGQPLPQANPEPADVAGPSGAQGDGPDNRAIAHFAREQADARYRAGELPNGAVMTEGERTLEDEAPLQYSEHDIPVGQRSLDRLVDWAEANPEATVIPPPLLPPAYQDATIATPGLPTEADFR